MTSLDELVDVVETHLMHMMEHHVRGVYRCDAEIIVKKVLEAQDEGILGRDD